VFVCVFACVHELLSVFVLLQRHFLMLTYSRAVRARCHSHVCTQPVLNIGKCSVNVCRIEMEEQVTCNDEICSWQYRCQEAFVSERYNSAAEKSQIFLDDVAVDVIADVRLDAKRGEIHLVHPIPVATGHVDNAAHSVSFDDILKIVARDPRKCPRAAGSGLGLELAAVFPSTIIEAPSDGYLCLPFGVERVVLRAQYLAVCNVCIHVTYRIP